MVSCRDNAVWFHTPRPVHGAAEDASRTRMSSHAMTEGKKGSQQRKKERRETIALGVKCRIWDFSQQCCSIYASRWQQPSQTCLCADVGELWEHVFFLSFSKPRHWLGMLGWAGGGYSNIFSDANNTLKMLRQKTIYEKDEEPFCFSSPFKLHFCCLFSHTSKWCILADCWDCLREKFHLRSQREIAPSHPTPAAISWIINP